MTREWGWLGFGGEGGRGPTSTHLDTARVWRGCAHDRWPIDPIRESSSSTRQSLSWGHRGLPSSVETLTFFSLIPIWGPPEGVCTHFLQATMEAELQGDMRGFGAAPSRPGLHHRGPSLPPSHLWAPGAAPLLPLPFHPQNL